MIYYLNLFGNEVGSDSDWKRSLAALNILIAITGYYFGQGERYQDFISYQDYLRTTSTNPTIMN
jgi:hypothetical protein